MSASVESRIVYMQFDNADFERKSKQTLQTLENLQNGLDMEEAAKKFEKLDDAANSVNLKGLTQSVTTLTQSFSAGEIMAKRFFENVTDWAMSASNKLLQMSKIDLVSGWSKYNQEIAGVQTIFSALPDETDEHVQSILDKLLWYTDETSYRYSDLVSNIAKFTSAGTSLDDATTALIGIANLTASAGQNAEAASHAMEAFSKAMARGRFDSLTLQSLSRYNINTKAFADTMYKYGKELGAIEEGAYNSATEALSDAAKWSNNEIVLKTLKEYGVYTDEVYKEYKKTGKMAFEIMQELDKAGMELSANAMTRAQETKTLSDYVGFIHETISTGWKTTFSTIVGDYHEATEFWSNLSEATYPIITRLRDIRNETAAVFKELGGREKLISIITKGVEILGKTLEAVRKAFSKALSKVFGFNDSLEDSENNGKLLYKIITRIDQKMTEFLNSDKFEKLQNTLTLVFTVLGKIGKAGFNIGKKLAKVLSPIWDVIVKIADTSLGSDILALLPVIKLLSDNLGGLSIGINPLTGLLAFLVTSITDFGDKLGPFLDDLKGDAIPIISNIIGILKKVASFVRGLFDYLSPIWNVIGSAIKFVSELFHILTTVIGRFLNVFPFGKKLKEWSKNGSWFEAVCNKIADTIDKLTTRLHNLWFGYDDVSKAQNEAGEGGVKHIFGWINAIDQWLYKNKEVFSSFSNFGQFIGDAFKKAWDTVKDWFSRITGSMFDESKEGVAKNIIDGFLVGISDYSTKIWDKISTIFNNVIEFVKDIFWIASPSKVFAGIGAFVIAGFIGGLVKRSRDIDGTTDDVFGGFIDNVKKLFEGKSDYGTIIDTVKGFFGVVGELFKQFYDFLTKNGEGNVFEGVMKIFGEFSKMMAFFGVGEAGAGMKSFPKQMTKTAEAFSKLTDFNFKFKFSSTDTATQFKDIAKALLIMVAAFVILAYAVSQFDETTLIWTVSIIGGMLLALAALSALSKKTQTKKSLKDLKNFSVYSAGIDKAMLKIALAIAVVAFAFKQILKAVSIPELTPARAGFGLLAFGALMTGLTLMVSGLMVLAVLLKKKVGGFNNYNFLNIIGGAMIAMSTSIYIMAKAFTAVVDAIGKSADPNAWWKAIIALGALIASAVAVFVIMMTVKTYMKNSKGTGTTVKSMADMAGAFVAVAGAVYTLAKALRLVISAFGKHDNATAIIALVALIGLIAIIGLLFTLVGKINVDEKSMLSFGGGVALFGVAMWILSKAMQEIAKMDIVELGKAVGVITIVLGLLMLVGLASSTRVGDGLTKFAWAMLILSGALLAASIAFYISAEALMTFLEAIVFADKNMEHIIKGIKVMSGVITEFVSSVLTGVADAVKKIVPQLIEIGIELLVGTIEGLADNVETLGKAFLKLLEAILDLINKAIPIVVEKTMDGLNNLLDALAKAIERIDYDKLHKVFLGCTEITAILGEMATWPLLVVPATLGAFLSGPLTGLIKSTLDVIALFGDISDDTESKVTRFSSVLGKILGAFTGEFIGQTVESATDHLDNIGDNLKDFAAKMTEFFNACVNFPENGVDKALMMTDVIKKLSTAMLITIIDKWWQKKIGYNLKTIGLEMVEFSKCMLVFAAYTDKIDRSTQGGVSGLASAAASLASAIAVFATGSIVNALPSAISALMGVDFSTYNESRIYKMCKILGICISGFYEATKAIPAEAAWKIKNYADAAEALTHVVTSLSEDGVFGAIKEFMTNYGSDDMANAGNLGKSFALIGRGLVLFNEEVTKITDTGKLTERIDILQSLIDVMESIPHSGVIVKLFTNDYDYEAFANGMAAMAGGMRKFYEAFDAKDATDLIPVAIKEINLEKMAERVNALKEFVDVWNTMEADGGWVNLYVTGSRITSWSTFGNVLPILGEGMRKFYDSFTYVNFERWEVMCGHIGMFLGKFTSPDKIKNMGDFVGYLITLAGVDKLKDKSYVWEFISETGKALNVLGGALDYFDLSKFQQTLNMLNSAMDDLPKDPVITPVLNAGDFMTGLAMLGHIVNTGGFAIDAKGVKNAAVSADNAAGTGDNNAEVNMYITGEKMSRIDMWKLFNDVKYAINDAWYADNN